MILTAENYFSKEANMEYMSVSQYKQFLQCEAMAMAELEGRYDRLMTTSLLVGSYVDAHFEGTLDIFKAKNPALFKKDGNLKSDYIKAEEIINRIEQDKMFMEYMSGEKQVIMTGTIEDIPIKIKIDSLCKDKIVDLKIMKDFEPIHVKEQGKLSFIEAWKYDLQGAIYQEIVRQNTGKQLPFYIAAATKETVTDIGIFSVSQEMLNYELNEFKKNVKYYNAIKLGIIEPQRCEHCNYCKQTKVLTEVINMEDLSNELCCD